jgi:hypothetical protein
LRDGQWRVNAGSRDRGLLAIFLLTDVNRGSAPTRLRRSPSIFMVACLQIAGLECAEYLFRVFVVGARTAGTATCMLTQVIRGAVGSTSAVRA